MHGMNLLETKLTALLLLLAGTLFCGCLPLVIYRFLPRCYSSLRVNDRRHRWLSFLIYLGSGFLFSAAMLYLLPQTHRDMSLHSDGFSSNASLSSEEEHRHGGSKDHHHQHHDSFPLPEFIVACGFFATYFVEALICLFHDARPSSPRDANHAVRAKFCSCSQRNIECSRIYKPDVGPARTEKRKRSATWAGQIIPSQQERQESPPDLLQSSLASQKFPNYGAAMASEPVGLPMRVDGITFVNRPVTLPPPLNLPRIPEIPNSNELSSSVTSIVANLSFYSLFEGIAIGFQNTVVSIWALFLAVAIHKFFTAFLIGLEATAEESKVLLTVVCITAFAIISPAGMAVAMLVGGSSLTAAVLNGLAAGALLYVICFEEFPKHTKRHSCNQFKFIGTILGAGVMAAIQYGTTYAGIS